MGIPKFDIVLSEPDLMARIDKLADRLAPRLTGDWSAINILIGATPFTSDLMKALARRDIHSDIGRQDSEFFREFDNLFAGLEKDPLPEVTNEIRFFGCGDKLTWRNWAI